MRARRAGFSPWLSDYPPSYCKRCSAVVVWMKTEAGKDIPLDPGWVRRVEGEGLGYVLYRPSTEEEGIVLVSAGPDTRVGGGYFSHIATCTATAPPGTKRRPE